MTSSVSSVQRVTSRHFCSFVFNSLIHRSPFLYPDGSYYFPFLPNFPGIILSDYLLITPQPYYISNINEHNLELKTTKFLLRDSNHLHFLNTALDIFILENINFNFCQKLISS